MTRSFHTIMTLCFLALHPQATVASDVQATRTDLSASQNIRPSGTYFTKKPTVRTPKEKSWQDARDLGNHYLNELRYELSQQREKGTLTCPSEKTLEKKLCLNWQRTPRNHQVTQTKDNPSFHILNFITATDITKRFAQQPCSAQEIKNTVDQAVEKYHPHFNRKKPVIFAEWNTVARRSKEIAQRIVTARKMTPTPESTHRNEIKTAR